MTDRNAGQLEEYSVVVFQVYKQEFRVWAPVDDPAAAIAAVNADKEHYTGLPIHFSDMPEGKWRVRAMREGNDDEADSTEPGRGRGALHESSAGDRVRRAGEPK